jgi:hypothetical protein
MLINLLIIEFIFSILNLYLARECTPRIQALPLRLCARRPFFGPDRHCAYLGSFEEQDGYRLPLDGQILSAFLAGDAQFYLNNIDANGYTGVVPLGAYPNTLETARMGRILAVTTRASMEQIMVVPEERRQTSWTTQAFGVHLPEGVSMKMLTRRTTTGAISPVIMCRPIATQAPIRTGPRCFNLLASDTELELRLHARMHEISTGRHPGHRGQSDSNGVLALSLRLG